MANPKIRYVSPANGSPSLPLDQTSGIWMEFDQPIDVVGFTENFFLEGPDTDQYIGPGMLELTSPDNISQGDVDNFLRSPGYKGIAEGTFSPTSGVASKIYFNPAHGLAPVTDYVAHLLGVYDFPIDGDPNNPDPTNWATASGFNWTFQTGTGSIQQLPSNLSTSVLAELVQHGWVATPSPVGALKVVKVSPEDHSVENDVHLEEIVIDFNKAIDPMSVTPTSIYVETLPVTDHPSAPVFAQGEIMTTLEVSGCQIKIKL
jgi:hypothetical protein